MRDYAEIFFKNNSIHRFRLRNPGKEFQLEYKVDDKKEINTYFYRRENTYIRKGLFFRQRVCFYEHGNPEPLNTSFDIPSINMKDISALLKTNLIEQLGASVKNKDLGMTTGAIIAVTSIIALVVIVIVG